MIFDLGSPDEMKWNPGVLHVIPGFRFAASGLRFLENRTYTK